jgi:YD repeat-containing protein
MIGGRPTLTHSSMIAGVFARFWCVLMEGFPIEDHAARPKPRRWPHDTVTVSGRTSTAVWDAASRTLTATSAGGRTSVVEVDLLGRAVSSREATFEPVWLSYDDRGHLSSMEEGAGAYARVTTLGYDPASGYLRTVRDPMDRLWSYVTPPRAA